LGPFTEDSKVRLVFLGAPGAGKGTQAAVLAEEFGAVHASTGDIFRHAIAEETELGTQVKDYLDGGKLVPDELTSAVVEEGVVEKEDSYILDGYPRTLQQAEDLEAMLDKRGMALDGVLYFQLGDEEAVKRLTGRLVCAQCKRNFHRDFMPPREQGVCDDCGGVLKVRSDSSEEIVRQRLEEYHEKTRPLVEFYEERGLLKRVDASPSPEDVTKATQDILRSLAEG
jgi:adenylate kinase